MFEGISGNYWVAHGTHTMTAVRNPINSKSWASVDDAVTPIQSAHPSGAHVGLADGSVMFMSEDVEVSILKNMADRSDGGSVYFQ